MVGWLPAAGGPRRHNSDAKQARSAKFPPYSERRPLPLAKTRRCSVVRVSGPNVAGSESLGSGVWAWPTRDGVPVGSGSSGPEGPEPSVRSHEEKAPPRKGGGRMRARGGPGVAKRGRLQIPKSSSFIPSDTLDVCPVVGVRPEPGRLDLNLFPDVDGGRHLRSRTAAFGAKSGSRRYNTSANLGLTVLEMNGDVALAAET